MSEPMVICPNCGVEFMKSTADLCGGVCRRCVGGRVCDKDVDIPLQKVGFWYSKDEPELPDPRQLVPFDWNHDEKIRVIQYLRSGRTLFGCWGHSECRFDCGIDTTLMGSADIYDGFWIWPEGLHHYVEVHDVPLPKEFLNHMRACGYNPETSWSKSKGVTDFCGNQYINSYNNWILLAKQFKRRVEQDVAPDR